MAEAQVGNEVGGARLAERSAFLRFLRPFLAVYGIGIVGTFAWLFFALSGTSACAASRDSCQIAVNLAGELALVWPAYWGDMFAGEPVMILTLPFEVVLTSMLAFAAVLAFAWGHALFERRAPKAANGEPLAKTAEPNRRNQSAAPTEAPAGQSWSGYPNSSQERATGPGSLDLDGVSKEPRGRARPSLPLARRRAPRATAEAPLGRYHRDSGGLTTESACVTDLKG
jgi:hypothetical protein